MPWSWPQSENGLDPAAEDPAAPCSWPWNFPGAAQGRDFLPGNNQELANHPCCPCWVIRPHHHPLQLAKRCPPRRLLPKRKIRPRICHPPPHRSLRRKSLRRRPSSRRRLNPARPNSSRLNRPRLSKPGLSSPILRKKFRIRSSISAQTTSLRSYPKNRPWILPATVQENPKPQRFKPEQAIARKARAKGAAPAHRGPESISANLVRAATRPAVQEREAVWSSSAHPAARASCAWLSPDIRTKPGVWARRGLWF
jgi:hypothetical protein